MANLTFTPPADGAAVTMQNGRLCVPDRPVIPFIIGDGTGPEIWAAASRVIDAAVAKAYQGRRSIAWYEVFAGQKSFDNLGTWLPNETVEAFRTYLIGIKGPLTTPVGGGIRTVEDFRAILREGADKISVNSAAIMSPCLISEAADKFGSQCVVLAVDAKRRADGSGFNIYKHGGRIDMGIDVIDWVTKAEKLGAGEILLTSMDCDGTKAGYDIELTRQVAEAVSVPVIASGGAGALAHFREALTEGKAEAALAASLFHYKELEIRQVKEFLAAEGVAVRL